MADTSQTTFSEAFPWMKFFFHFDSNFNEVCSYGSNKQKVINGLDNGLTTNRHDLAFFFQTFDKPFVSPIPVYIVICNLCSSMYFTMLGLIIYSYRKQDDVVSGNEPLNLVLLGCTRGATPNASEQYHPRIVHYQLIKQHMLLILSGLLNLTMFDFICAGGQA